MTSDRPTRPRSTSAAPAALQQLKGSSLLHVCIEQAGRVGLATIAGAADDPRRWSPSWGAGPAAIAGWER
jgi:hypothetical protein